MNLLLKYLLEDKCVNLEEFSNEIFDLLYSEKLLESDYHEVCGIKLSFSSITFICNYLRSRNIVVDNIRKPNAIFLDRSINGNTNINHIYKYLISIDPYKIIKNKKAVDIFLKQYNDFCERYKWDDYKIEDVCNELKSWENIDDVVKLVYKYSIDDFIMANNLFHRTIIDIAAFYAKIILKKDRDKISRDRINSNPYKIYVTLISLNNEEDIINYLMSVDYNKEKYQNLYKNVANFMMFYSKYEAINSDELLLSIKSDLVSKINKYVPIVIKKKKNFANKYDIKISRCYVSSYIESDYLSIKQFCKHMKLNEEVFKNHIEIVSIYDKEQYDKFKEKYQAQREKTFIIMKNRLKNIISFIKNGMLNEDGNVLEFSLLDYYLYFNFPLNKLFSFMSKCNLNEEESLVINNFINRYKNEKILNENDLMKLDILIINDHVISLKDKINIMSYLNENNIPITLSTYKSAANRLVNNLLNKEYVLKPVKK